MFHSMEHLRTSWGETICGIPTVKFLDGFSSPFTCLLGCDNAWMSPLFSNSSETRRLNSSKCRNSCCYLAVPLNLFMMLSFSSLQSWGQNVCSTYPPLPLYSRNISKTPKYLSETSAWPTWKFCFHLHLREIQISRRMPSEPRFLFALVPRHCERNVSSVRSFIFA